MTKLKSKKPSLRGATLRVKFRTRAIHTSRVGGLWMKQRWAWGFGNKGGDELLQTTCIRQLCVIKNIWCWGMGWRFGVKGSSVREWLVLEADGNPCPMSCVLRVKTPTVQLSIVHIVKTLAFVSAKCAILINLSAHKPHCFRMENWFEESCYQ